MFDYDDYDGTEPPSTAFKFIMLFVAVFGFMEAVGAIASYKGDICATVENHKIPKSQN